MKLGMQAFQHQRGQHFCVTYFQYSVFSALTLISPHTSLPSHLPPLTPPSPHTHTSPLHWFICCINRQMLMTCLQYTAHTPPPHLHVTITSSQTSPRLCATSDSTLCLKKPPAGGRTHFSRPKYQGGPPKCTT